MNKLIISNLLYRPVRSPISVTGIAVEIVLILVIVGLLLGVVKDSRERQQGMGAGIMVQPPGTSFMMGLSGLPMPTKLADKLSRLPHVVAATPVGVQLNTTGGVETIYGIDPASFVKMAGPFTYLPGFSRVVQIVIAVATIIGFIVIFQTMYTAVLERTHEIGILKSLGSSKRSVVALVLRETVLLAFVGAAMGIAASFLARWVLNNRFPTMQVLIDTKWLLYASIIAIAGAVLGGTYPAFQAAKKDPIEALAYE